VVVLAIVGCTTVDFRELCALLPSPSPEPSPSPVPSPTPTPSPLPSDPPGSPSPTPSGSPTPPPVDPADPACAAAETGPEVCTGDFGGVWQSEVEQAVRATAEKYQDPLGRIPYAAWDIYHIEIVQRLRHAGLCAGFYAEEIGVFPRHVGPGPGVSENYDPLTASGVPIWGYRSTCRPATLTREDFPTVVCPYALGAGKIELRLHNDEMKVFDATLKVCHRAYCDSVSSHNQCCSPGGGDGQQTACEAALYGLSNLDDEPGPSWRLTGGGRPERRSLTMVRVHEWPLHGSLQACTSGGVCSEVFTW